MEQGNSEVWSALTRVLRMGGKLGGDSTFVAPYVYAFWPDSIDAFEYVAVVTPNTPAREEPDRARPPIGKLAHLASETRGMEESGGVRRRHGQHLGAPGVTEQPQRVGQRS